MLLYTYRIRVVSRASKHAQWVSMLAMQELATIKGDSKMFSFITQPNATDVSSIEGACNWHADCRNVQRSCCP